MRMLTNPVLLQELRRRMRGNRAMIMLSVYLGLISIITLLIYLAFLSSVSGEPDIEDGRNIGKTIFITIIVTALVQVSIITPSLTAGSIAGEKERQSFDLLITTMLTPVEIVFGKLGAALAFAMLLIFAVLPLAALSFLFGGVSGTELAVGMIILVVTAMLYASVGIFWSVVAHTTLGATVRAQASIIFVLLGIPFLLFIMGIAEMGGQDIFDQIADIPLFVYIIGAVLCSHPFLAFAFTEAALSEGESAWFFTIDPGTQDILIPAPWLAYVFLSILFTGLFLFLTVRLLKPVHYRLKKEKLS